MSGWKRWFLLNPFRQWFLTRPWPWLCRVRGMHYWTAPNRHWASVCGRCGLVNWRHLS